jgi:hypothetical protein
MRPVLRALLCGRREVPLASRPAVRLEALPNASLVLVESANLL